MKNKNLKRIKKILDEYNVDEDYDNILSLLEKDLKDKKYGLVWERHEENIEKLLKDKIPYLEENKNLSVFESDKEKINHMLIEGDNLLALHILQRSGKKIDVIYIDPPYNTGKNFIYNDKRVDREDIYMHSKWLSFMNIRLRSARNLMNEEGIIFISINDIEQAQLKLLMDDIFGEENFISKLTWANKEGGGGSDNSHFNIKHEYILVYAKDISKAVIHGINISNEDRYKERDEHYSVRGPYYLQKLGMGSIQYSASLDYPITCPDGSTIYPKDNNNGRKACWRWGKEKLKWGFENDYVVIKKDSNDIWTAYTKQYLNADNEGNIIDRTIRPSGIIDDYSSTQASKHLDDLMGEKVFSYPKPVELIEYLLKLSTDQNSIILDFFAGSGTTMEAVLKLNELDQGSRQCILVTNNEINPEDEQEFLIDNNYIEAPENNRKNTIAYKEWFSNYMEYRKSEEFGDVSKKDEYKKMGICRSVTYKRIEKLLTGYKTNVNTNQLIDSINISKSDIVYNGTTRQISNIDQEENRRSNLIKRIDKINQKIKETHDKFIDDYDSIDIKYNEKSIDIYGRLKKESYFKGYNNNNNLVYYEINFLDKNEDYYEVENALLNFSEELIKIKHDTFNVANIDEKKKHYVNNHTDVFISTDLFIDESFVDFVKANSSRDEIIIYVLKENINDLKLKEIDVDAIFAIPDRFVNWVNL